MLKLFLSSHGHMASGMKSSIEIFCGENNNLTVFDAYVDEKNVSEQLDAFYQTVGEDDQVILLSDVYVSHKTKYDARCRCEPRTRIRAHSTGFHYRRRSGKTGRTEQTGIKGCKT